MLHLATPSHRAWTTVPLRARLVRLREAPPHPALAADVERLWWLEASAPLPAPVVRGCAAKAAVDVVFTLEGHFAAQVEASLLGRGERAPYLIGPTSAPAEAVSSGRCVAVGARLRPGRAAALLRTAAPELRDEVVLLETLCPREVRGEAGVREPGAPEDALDALERVLLALRARAGAPDPLVDEAVRRIARRRGRVAVEALARGLGIGVRRLQRRFRGLVGLSPKRGCRIARLEHASALLAGGAADFGDVVDACGFHDQAHLIREFRQLAGLTPGAFQRASAGCGEGLGQAPRARVASVQYGAGTVR